jgi:hypothetical protein
MSKYELKTKENDADVLAFIDSVKSEQRREDAKKLLKIFEEVTGYPAKMWGSAIIGFGSYHYKYPSGQEGDMPLTGFSPRVQAMTAYISTGFDEYAEASGYDPAPLLKRLGKHTTGKVCLYFKKLSDIDESILRQLIKDSVTMMEARKKREGQ